MTKRRRLDEILLAQSAIKDKKEAFIIVTEGRVFTGGQKAISPAQMIGEDTNIEMKNADGYVGRGAYKLEGALAAFAIDTAGKICADIGAATGGFTEVLLRRGAAKVYAIDTARGKLALKIRQDPRVVVMERTDVRHLASLPDVADPVGNKYWHASETGKPQKIHTDKLEFVSMTGVGVPQWSSHQADIAVIDVSLISLRDILGSVRRLLKSDGIVIALFKPQYETRDPSILHHGVIRDPAAREKFAEDFAAWAACHGWEIKGRMESPIRGDKGNVEYLFYLKQV